MEIVLPSIFPSKTKRFTCQRYMAPLKLQHMAAIFFLKKKFFYFEVFIYIYGSATPLGHRGGGRLLLFWPRGWLRPVLG
jgi:hypothetical protein